MEVIQQENCNSINILPIEVLEYILSFTIRGDEIGCWNSLELVCRKWYGVCLAIRSRRYHTLVANTQQSSLKNIITHLNQFQYLNKLKLTQSHEDVVDSTHLRTAKHIQELRVERFALPMQMIVRYFPYLRSIDLLEVKNGISVREIAELSTLDNLTDLQVRLQLSGDTNLWSSAKIAKLLRNLKSLTLAGPNDSYLYPHLPSIVGSHLANLQSLDLRCMIECFDLISRNLDTLNLTELSISEHSLSSSTLKLSIAYLVRICASKSLRKLSLKSLAPLSCAVQAFNLFELCHVDSLEELVMEGFYFNANVIQLISEKCARIRKVRFQQGFLNMILNERLIDRWFSTMPHLEVMSFSGICANCTVEYEYCRELPCPIVQQTKDIRKYNNLSFGSKTIQRNP